MKEEEYDDKETFEFGVWMGRLGYKVGEAPLSDPKIQFGLKAWQERARMAKEEKGG